MAKEPKATDEPKITEDTAAAAPEQPAPKAEAETAAPKPAEAAEGAPEAEAISETGPADAPARAKRKKNRRTVTTGQIHVLATFNNTIITVTDDKGNALASASAGGSGFRGSKKGTAYAAQIAAEKAISTARQNFGLTKADVFVKGVGMGRDAAIRTLVSQKVQLENIKDVTGIPHGGVRPRRPKRN
jgi:small subunit ribosomal protein S11